MAYDFITVNTDYIQYPAAAVTAYPFTMACWVYPDTLTTFRTALAIGPQNSAAVTQRIGVNSTSVVAQSESTTAVVSAVSSAAPTTGRWNHIAGVFTSATSRAAYLNGGNKGTETVTNATFSTSLNRTLIGIRLRSNIYAQGMDGKIAECAIWNIDLSDDEIYSLSLGLRANLVRPQNLKLYSPIIRSTHDVAGALVPTTNGTPAVFQHPRRYG